MTTCDIQWLLYLLDDLRVSRSKATPLYCDSQSAIQLASNPTFHARTKHIDLDCHLVRDKVKEGVIRLLPVRTQHQLADVFTKPLGSGPFRSLTSKLGIIDTSAPACGGLTEYINKEHG